MERKEGEIEKKHKDSFGCNGYVHYLDWGEGFPGENMSKFIKMYNYVQFILCQLYFNETIGKKIKM